MKDRAFSEWIREVDVTELFDDIERLCLELLWCDDGVEAVETVLLSTRRVLLCHVGDSGGVIGWFCGAVGYWEW